MPARYTVARNACQSARPCSATRAPQIQGPSPSCEVQTTVIGTAVLDLPRKTVVAARSSAPAGASSSKRRPMSLMSSRRPECGPMRIGTKEISGRRGPLRRSDQSSIIGLRPYGTRRGRYTKCFSRRPTRPLRFMHGNFAPVNQAPRVTAAVAASAGTRSIGRFSWRTSS